MNGVSDYDILVIGAGAAGLYAALCLPSQFSVGLITKDTVSKSASDWAQGGIAAAIAPDDSPQLHIEDTLSAGAGLCDRDAVALMAQQAGECIEALLDMGVAFDRSTQGQLAMTLEAAHSRRRVLHAADTTGRAIVAILGQQVLQRPNIQVLNQTFALDLWLTSDQACQGVIALHQDRLRWLSSRAVVLATGGGGQVFSNTTNPSLSTGDGVAMAWRAGARLRDLEFVQFHPTALAKAGAPRFLISEAVRGEGAHLVDGTGRRFAYDYHPEGELAPRDVVSRAITSHLQKSGDPQVWLDLRPIPKTRIEYRFPNIIAVCRQWGVDPLSEPIPVSPAAHYWMGGVHTALTSETSVRNLYAVGETASTGVHGANRLASNSLLECLVFGAQLRTIALPEPTHLNSENGHWPQKGYFDTRDSTLSSAARRQQLDDIRQQLSQQMWQCAGIIREQSGLEAASRQVATWRQMVPELSPLTSAAQGLEATPVADVLRWGEARNLLDIAALILRSATFRSESRGGHYRSDYPEAKVAWQAHTLVEGDALWLEPANVSSLSSSAQVQA